MYFVLYLQDFYEKKDIAESFYMLADIDFGSVGSVGSEAFEGFAIQNSLVFVEL